MLARIWRPPRKWSMLVAPAGIPEDKLRIVNENSNTLKFKTHEFEEE
jgi:hypothetical protein